jgi:uncharacterized RDD family membrane protein YckC
MSTPAPPPAAPPAGYLSEESKRRFTLVAGVLGTVIFLAQMVLPAAVMFAMMMPTMFSREFKQVDVDGAALWRGDLWLTEESTPLRGGKSGESTRSLRRLRTSDLEAAGPDVPIGETLPLDSVALLPIGDRLWILGTEETRYYEGGSLVRLGGEGRPDRSRPFAYGGKPAALDLGLETTLTTLEVEGTQARWTAQELDLRLPPGAGALHALQALEVDGRLLLFAQMCTSVPEQCTIGYRALDGPEWKIATEQGGSGEWSLAMRGAHPVVVLPEGDKGRRTSRYTFVTLAPGGPRRETVDVEGAELAWKGWRALASGERLLLLTRRLGATLRLDEVADGRVVASVKKHEDVFPFGGGFFLLMLIPQLLPIALSFVLALVLTSQMRMHRVGEYVHGDERRRFASLWQRALAQAVDAIPIALAFALPVAGMWRTFSDPESFVEGGGRFMAWFFGGILAAFVVSALVLLAYSYFEGRSGQTPGKRLMGIRVLGTDLQPCGFGRAVLRNLLTFVDGFFNFLVGALMVAFTENWQRLGDFAARTVVVADEKG